MFLPGFKHRLVSLPDNQALIGVPSEVRVLSPHITAAIGSSEMIIRGVGQEVNLDIT